MKRRLFVAVNVPDDIKEKIAGAVEEIKYNFGEKTRFVSKDNWHFTPIFLGYQDEEKLPAIKEAMEKFAAAAKKTDINPKITFEKLTYGPLTGLAKRMIWLTADADSTRELMKIKKLLTNELFGSGIRWQTDNRPVSRAHLTLARFMPRNIKQLPPVEREIGWQFLLATIDLMESHLRRDGPIYEKISSIAIK